MKFWKRVRSAITGRFVKRSEAQENPTTTVEERIPKRIVAEAMQPRDVKPPE
jgi:hypothetical protein